ncbi:MAG: thiamine-phosphate kinase [Bacteroidetes bacterium]|nr:MAG: thiamine-phosphate kinase [Bacteroidota bacterium]RLD74406.1 MAG: thiamine-phosphate kinase [Bacteroidota bacterium]
MSESGSKLTELSSLGEFGLIEHLTKNIPIVNKSTVKGIGDDAAVLKPASGSQVLVSKDLLIEGVHFDLMYMPLKHLGYKAAVVNFSDIVAMNGVPKQIVVGISVSSKYTVEALEEIYAGIKKACDVYKVDFVGGDTTSSVSGLFISVTVIGEVKKDKITYRSGAGVNDLLCVSGDLGSAYMGLLILEREKKAFQANPDMQPDLSDHDYILERQLKPEARTDLVKLFSDEEIVPTSMIDISDGLASEALHICKASDKGCLIYEEKIPVDQDTYDTAREFGIVPTVAALNGGEDYELLFTIKQNDYDKIKDSQDITVIGYITEKAEGEKLVTTDNHVFDLKAQGWDALKKRDLGDLTSNTKKS